ncbi:MAG: nicotinate (nicotinamide) nucleotide adenylyltransferase [Oscillospiraceae bacterium]|jgi:nicotinate-nucleotide adenylyltransferase|nr:nicotinate (nicotinamide) nucleotide adenylyltransferase [Oscillospiraceae bacterium]
MRVLLYGGAFDPPHNGHVNIVRSACKELKIKSAVIIPTGHSPHKDGGNVSFVHRAEMARLAFGVLSENGIEIDVSEVENRVGKSYTINTLRDLKEVLPKGADTYFLIGADMLYYFDKWYKYESILKETHIVAAARSNTDSYADMVEYSAEIGHIKVLNLPIVETSSTAIREGLKTGADISEYLAPKVYEYIKANKLYEQT